MYKSKLFFLRVLKEEPCAIKAGNCEFATGFSLYPRVMSIYLSIFFFLLMGGKKSCNDDRLDKSNYVSVVQIALSVFVSMFSVLTKNRENCKR